MMSENPHMELNMSALLLAIAMVESANKPEAIGAKGEVSQYQISRAVWRKHAPTVKFDPKQAWQATAVATKHIRWLNGKLDPHLRNRPFWIAVAWNGGLGAVEKSKVKGEYWARHVPKKMQDYGDRVRAMYHLYEKDARCIKRQVDNTKAAVLFVKAHPDMLGKPEILTDTLGKRIKTTKNASSWNGGPGQVIV